MSPMVLNMPVSLHTLKAGERFVYNHKLHIKTDKRNMNVEFYTGIIKMLPSTTMVEKQS